MRVDNIFLNLNLSDLSALPRAVHLDNKFILIDNLNDTLDDSDSQISPFESYPIKLSFTIVMIVIKGGIKLKINLQEFEARNLFIQILCYIRNRNFLMRLLIYIVR